MPYLRGIGFSGNRSGKAVSLGIANFTLQGFKDLGFWAARFRYKGSIGLCRVSGAFLRLNEALKNPCRALQVLSCLCCSCISFVGLTGL